MRARASSPRRRPTRRCEPRSCAARSTHRSGGSRALLRQLYIQGEPDPIAVILGATSIDEVMTGIEGLSRATAQNERLAREAAEKGRRLTELRATLAAQRERLDSAREAARAGTAQARGRRVGAARDRRQDPSPGRLDAAATRSAAGAGPARPSSARPTSPLRQPERQHRRRSLRARRDDLRHAGELRPRHPAPVTGTHTLVVDAVAYHLPGRTASGLPVGVGVIAVDPTVIPLGTRVFVPGYGPAVAADVGTAIKGNIIDLWMPTTAQALAWGRRTVTITVYG